MKLGVGAFKVSESYGKVNRRAPNCCSSHYIMETGATAEELERGDHAREELVYTESPTTILEAKRGDEA